MAFDWFKVDADFPSHPKTVRLSKRLGNPLAGFYMVNLWSFCVEYQQDGMFSGEDAAAMLEHASGWAGKPGEFLTAVLAAGFIDDHGEGRYYVHDWVERNGAHLRKKIADAERQRTKRASIAPVSRDGRATVAAAALDGRPLEERESRVEENIPRSARLGVGSPAFEAVQHWRGTVWPKMSTALCPDVTSRQIDSLGGLSSKHGPAVVCAAMDRAAADPFWADKLDLDTFVAKFPRFLPRNATDPPKAARGMQAVGTDWNARL